MGPHDGKKEKKRNPNQPLMLAIGPVRLNLSARISQPFSSIFLSQQISISISTHHKNQQPNSAI
jgi:hypothetical protein